MKRPLWLHFILREWLLVAAMAALALTCFYVGKFSAPSAGQWQVLGMLYGLFIAAKGLENSGLLAWFSWKAEQGTFVPLKLVLTTFFLAMIVTNDVALIVLVPVTLAIHIPHKEWVVILEALAANAGSALTPVGNPQNLFLYWHYHVSLVHFIATMAPLTLVFLGLLTYWSARFQQGRGEETLPDPDPPAHRAWLFSGLLVLIVLVVVHILPVPAAGAAVVLAVAFDRRALQVDYALLATFFCFFGVAQNLQHISLVHMDEPRQVFFWSALSSQVISNVPAAILFAKVTSQWKALLWGSNVGGFGSIVGSLANLIAYRMYVRNKSKKEVLWFTGKFLVAGYAAFVLSMVIFLGLFQ